MRRLVSAAILGLMVVSPMPAWSQKKGKGAKDGSPASPQDYVQLQGQKELTGKLANFDGKSSITFRLEIQQLEPNPAFKPGSLGKGAGGIDLQRRLNEILRDQADVARAKNPAEKQRRMMELQRSMARLQADIAKAMAKGATGKPGKDGPFKITTESKDYELDLADKVVVRWANPPFEYDDKGNPKVYTKEELAKLKGSDPKLPGYAGKLEDLAPGQGVRLFLTPPPKDTTKKVKLPDEVEGVGNVARPTVHTIIITAESSLPVPPPKKGKK